jgi:Uma2 family endonuclease
MTQDEFFAWQERQDKLYELVDGLPILPLKMMTGASQRHDRIVVNVILALGNQLRGGPCRPTTDDLAVRIPAGNVRRPDITVECGGQGGAHELAVREPRAVIEVLSPSTMNFDRIRKLPEYQTIPSVAYIMLIDTDTPRVDLWSREANGHRRQAKHNGLGARVELAAIGAALPLADVFEGLEFEDRPLPDDND